MAYNKELAEKVRAYLKNISQIKIEEKKMFGGLAFMINGKMCVNVSGENLMCRFDPSLTTELAGKPGFKTMVMKGRTYKGYCYVEPEGFQDTHDFEYWIDICLTYNKTI
jgi:hypothetical protein